MATQIAANTSRVLTTKGYAVLKSSLTDAVIASLRKDLTVTPLMPGKIQTPAKPFTIYKESPTRFYIPRMYGRNRFGIEEANVVPEGLPLPSTIFFKGTPYDYQNAIIDSFIAADCNGLICVPCGKGKTFMALAAAIRLGKRFLVVVDKEFLLLQWKKEIEAFIGGSIRIGVVQGTLCQTDPAKYDITICMIQTLCSREFPEGTFSTYGLSIFDECHHLGAAYFSRTLMKIQTAAQLGLSATPVRDDGLTKVFEWYLGKPVYWEKTREPDTTVSVWQIKFSTTEPEYNNIPTDYKGDIVMARMLGQICKSPERNTLIAKLILKFTKDPHRRILVLSERREHLQLIEEELSKLGFAGKYGYYVGGMKEKVREQGASEAIVLLASYSMASEAMNIKKLNTVIFASPRKKIEQSSGRILRQRVEERVADPIIADITDSHGIYLSQWRKRYQYYKQCGYKIHRKAFVLDDEDSDGDDKDDKDSDKDDKDSDKDDKDNKDLSLTGCVIIDS